MNTMLRLNSLSLSKISNTIRRKGYYSRGRLIYINVKPAISSFISKQIIILNSMVVNLTLMEGSFLPPPSSLHIVHGINGFYCLCSPNNKKEIALDPIL